jgi:hypothetical protein
MNYALLIPLLVTTVVAIIGWIAGHLLTAARDRANKRRELRVQFLIDAYRKLEAAANRDGNQEPDWPAFETAIADIQLFGTKSQVENATTFADEFASKGTYSLSRLLMDLRSDLREELRLEPIKGTIMHLRVEGAPAGAVRNQAAHPKRPSRPQG